MSRCNDRTSALRKAAVGFVAASLACGGGSSPADAGGSTPIDSRAPTPPPAKTPANAPTRAVPDTPTFAEHVAPIIYKECTPCHREGGSAPFVFASYDDVRDHARQIVELTAAGTMPPWLPVPQRGEFRGARVLDDVARTTIARWVEQGSAPGDSSAMPSPPVFEDGWTLGTPDLVLETGEPFVLSADGRDVYRNFVIPVPPGPMRFVQGVEIRPGDPAVVHHGVLRIDTSGEARRLDAAEAAPGFDGMEFAGSRIPDGRFIGWTPGKQPTPLDEPGAAARSWRLFGGSDLVLQLHLRPSGKPEPIAAQVGLFFAPAPPTVPALAIELSSMDIDLPPGSTDVHVRDQYKLPVDVSVASIYPHAHYLGKSVQAWAMLPDGQRRWLLEIDDWDFDWQDQYRYVKPLRLPAGSTIFMDWGFDNSAANPHNPSSPPQAVRYGPESSDEMAELILEVEPVDPRTIAALDQSFRRKWLMAQVKQMERTLADAPDDADAAANLGAFRQHLGQIDAAVQAYERALAIDPAHVQANVELSIVRMSQGRLDQAKALLRRVVARVPGDARAHRLLADVLRKQGQATEAIAEYRASLAHDDSSAQAHNNLGIMLERQGSLGDAAEHFQRAAELAPAQAVYAKNLARVRAKSP